MATVNFTASHCHLDPRSREERKFYLGVNCDMSRDDMKSVLRGIQSVVSGAEWDALLKEVDNEEE